VSARISAPAAPSPKPNAPTMPARASKKQADDPFGRQR
jgi:hypothetical protein